jgi:predicted nucleic-acid-binding Zn-ribbon protein
MGKVTHCSNITKECKACGKRTRFKQLGQLMGGNIGLPMMLIVKDEMQCPKCGVVHKYEQEPTFPMVREGPWREIRT